MNKETLPKIELKNFDWYIAIHTPTHKDYDKLMQILEAGGVQVSSSFIQSPTSINMWKHNKENTCIKSVRNKIYSSSIDYEIRDSKIFSPEKFYYDFQKLSPEKVSEVNSWFDKNKPIRNSRG